MTGCHDDASGLADRSRSGGGRLAGLLAGGQVGDGMAPPDPRASERSTAHLKEISQERYCTYQTRQRPVLFL
jgi:hypothetical protein